MLENIVLDRPALRILNELLYECNSICDLRLDIIINFLYDQSYALIQLNLTITG